MGLFKRESGDYIRGEEDHTDGSGYYSGEIPSAYGNVIMSGKMRDCTHTMIKGGGKILALIMSVISAGFILVFFLLMDNSPYLDRLLVFLFALLLTVIDFLAIRAAFFTPVLQCSVTDESLLLASKHGTRTVMYKDIMSIEKKSAGEVNGKRAMFYIQMSLSGMELEQELQLTYRDKDVEKMFDALNVAYNAYKERQQ